MGCGSGGGGGEGGGGEGGGEGGGRYNRHNPEQTLLQNKHCYQPTINIHIIHIQ